MSLIDVCAKNAKSAKDRRILSQMAEGAREYQRKVEEMPEWAKERRIDTRVPLMNKVKAENLEYREWTSKKGTPMMAVTFLDGTVREFAYPSSKWIRWNEFSN